MRLDESVLDELLEEYVRGDDDGTPTSERVFETALAADAAEMIEHLNRVIALVREGNVSDPATRADLIQEFGRLRTFLWDADRILRATNVSGVLSKVPAAKRETG